ncbi:MULTISPECIES: 2'-deoxycytidine 5'-triphosphate deaminase domain-containing protein [Flavobacteriaceae]|uniref:2'-deoxycytidine 5'-triphosphate deaminase domain-containing protein n=1 Tax=Flavobacteriaceae TaxID=49546 RepID=UPI002349A015|nr:2'-deoxycytidine 5'-triphosphate deaminase [Muricauda sp. SP22]MDC6362154.1 2'-deoxycytidine 5'-triphosphate deaminase [Muricauda sp. SP22]
MIWIKESWLPGVLSKKQLKKVIDNGWIERVDNFEAACDHSSLDIHLDDEGFEMISGSFKPFGIDNYSDFLKNVQFAKPLSKNKNGEYQLESSKTYVFKIRERFSAQIKQSRIYAQATAKSSIGRMDVIARLIVDGMHEYEYMDPTKLNTGYMYLEITPVTFNVKIKPGISLSQIRLFFDPPENSIIPSSSISEVVLSGGDHTDGTLSVDLSNINCGNKAACAYKAIGVKQNNKEFIQLWDKEFLDPEKYWERLESEEIKGKVRFKIEPNEFYILRSKERIKLPKGVAVYCRAMDETLGEMRIHYAGFVHPFFGVDRVDHKVGTPLIYEVRGHNVSVNLGDKEKLAKLVFYRMSEDSEPIKKKKAGTSSDKNIYSEQELKLSKFFKDWPTASKI